MNIAVVPIAVFAMAALAGLARPSAAQVQRGAIRGTHTFGNPLEIVARRLVRRGMQLQF